MSKDTKVIKNWPVKDDSTPVTRKDLIDIIKGINKLADRLAETDAAVVNIYSNVVSGKEEHNCKCHKKEEQGKGFDFNKFAQLQLLLGKKDIDPRYMVLFDSDLTEAEKCMLFLETKKEKRNEKIEQFVELYKGISIPKKYQIIGALLVNLLPLGIPNDEQQIVPVDTYHDAKYHFENTNAPYPLVVNCDDEQFKMNHESERLFVNETLKIIISHEGVETEELKESTDDKTSEQT